jgi:hypothetical protein
LWELEVGRSRELRRIMEAEVGLRQTLGRSREIQMDL